MRIGVKLPAYKAGLPGKEMDSIWIVPLHPAYKAGGLAGHAPVIVEEPEGKELREGSLICSREFRT